MPPQPEPLGVGKESWPNEIGGRVLGEGDAEGEFGAAPKKRWNVIPVVGPVKEDMTWVLI